MATYLQGVQDFIPQVQPWSPDFNFYQNVMERKQQAYDQGWKQMNSIYSSLLNSPMMREDTSAKRDALFRSIENDINRLAGVDLSLPQNVQAAKQIFKPITNDKNIIHDIGYTQNYQNQLQAAEAFRNCTDPKECGGMYWDDGVKYLNYKAEEYRNAPAEFALGMSAAQYIPYTDKVDKAYDMLFDKFKEKKLSYSNGKYIIEETNGTHLVVPMASYLARTIGNDPQVQAMYKVKAYNARKDWESQNAGNYGSPEQATNYYIQNVIKPATEINESVKDDVSQERQNRESELNAFRTAISKEGIIPGSKEHKDYINTENAFQRAVASEKAIEKTIANAYSINQMNNMRAKEMNSDATVAQSMLFNDLIGVATSYQQATYERQIKGPDPYSLASYNKELEFDNWFLKELWKKVFSPDDIDPETGKDKSKKTPDNKTWFDVKMEEILRTQASPNNVFDQSIDYDENQSKEGRINIIKEELEKDPKYKDYSEEALNTLAENKYDNERNAIKYNQTQGEDFNDKVQAGKINNIVLTLNHLLQGPKTDENKVLYNNIVDQLGLRREKYAYTDDGKRVITHRTKGRSKVGGRLEGVGVRRVPDYESAINEKFKFTTDLLKSSKLSFTGKVREMNQLDPDQTPLLTDLYDPLNYYEEVNKQENIYDNIDNAWDYILNGIKSPWDDSSAKTIHSAFQNTKLSTEFLDNWKQIETDEESLNGIIEVTKRQMYGEPGKKGFIDKFILEAKTLGATKEHGQALEDLLTSITVQGGDVDQITIASGYEKELKSIFKQINPRIDESIMNTIFTHLKGIDDNNTWVYEAPNILDETATGEFEYPGFDFWMVTPTRIDENGDEVEVSIQELDKTWREINKAYSQFLGIAAENMFLSSGFEKSQNAWKKDLMEMFPMIETQEEDGEQRVLRHGTRRSINQIGHGMSDLLDLIYTAEKNIDSESDSDFDRFMKGENFLTKEREKKIAGIGLHHRLQKMTNELRTYGSFVGDTGVPSITVPGKGKKYTSIDNTIGDNESTQLLQSLLIHVIEGNSNPETPTVPLTFAEGFTNEVIKSMSAARNSEEFMKYLPGDMDENNKSSMQALEILKAYGDWITSYDDKNKKIKRLTPSIEMHPDVDGKNFAIQLKLDPEFLKTIKGTEDVPGIGALRDEEGNLVLDGDKVQLITGLSENGLVFNIKDDTALGQVMKQQIMTSNFSKAVQFKGYYDGWNKIISPRTGSDLKIILDDATKKFTWDENAIIKVFDSEKGEYQIQNLKNSIFEETLSSIDINNIDDFITMIYNRFAEIERDNNTHMQIYKMLNGAIKDPELLRQITPEMYENMSDTQKQQFAQQYQSL